MNAVSPGVPSCLPGGTSTPWECAEGTGSFSPTLVSQTTWPWLGESVDQLPVAPQHSLFRLCHPIKLELWIPPPPGGTSTPWECAEGTRSLSTTLVSQTGMALTGHVQGSASCCFATQPVQAVPPRVAPHPIPLPSGGEGTIKIGVFDSAARLSEFIPSNRLLNDPHISLSASTPSQGFADAMAMFQVPNPVSCCLEWLVREGRHRIELHTASH